MYEAFYNLTEKPFTLLPDPGFLYLSDKHRMALTLLEYGLIDHAGFTVISGEIGAGKTTLIRHLLNKMEQEYTVGLISNTHRSFGELLHWILLAFNLDHQDMNKVEMYQRFIDFIIDEYAQNRRTVLIVDEAQNMDAETLEELRMLSNINADKDQALQVILVGQRELRETLKRPDLVQFAQRITVDYHLEPLSATETEGYIRHRMEVAGGNPSTFSPEACRAVHRYSNGVPRLINLLCDTALVYGYAEQLHSIGPKLVTDVAREKQKGGIFPVYASAEEDIVSIEDDVQPAPQETVSSGETATVIENEPDGVEEPAVFVSRDIQHTSAEEVSTVARLAAYEVSESPPTDNGPALSGDRATRHETQNHTPSGSVDDEAEYRWLHGHTKKKLRIAICSVEENSRRYLSRLLESYGFEIVTTLPINAAQLAALDPSQLDALLVDSDAAAPLTPESAGIISNWNGPVLYNDAATTATSLREGNPDFGILLSEQINSLVDASRADMVASK